MKNVGHVGGNAGGINVICFNRSMSKIVKFIIFVAVLTLTNFIVIKIMVRYWNYIDLPGCMRAW